MSLPAARVEQRSSSSPGLLDLPVELLSFILTDVVAYARTARFISNYSPPSGEVGNVLCICSQIHKLAIPILYNKLQWQHHLGQERWGYRLGWESQILANTLRVHPEYARHVRHFLPPDYDTIDLSPIQKVLEVADAVKAAWQAVPPSDFGLESVTLRCQPFSYEVAIEVLRKLQPLRCHLISVPGIFDDFEYRHDDKRPLELRLIQMVREEPWLSRLTNLYFDGFMLDRPAAFLLSNLPNLVRLSLTVTDCYVETEAVECVELLLSGSKLEQLLVQRFPLEMRRLVQQRIGVCIPTVPDSTFSLEEDRSPPNNESYQRVWHGCQETESLLPGSAKHEILPITAGERCPRCCVIADQVQTERLSDHARLLYAEPAHTTAGGPCPDKTTRYDLCKRHDDEIFGSGLGGENAYDGKDLLGRRALECMRWFRVGPKGKRMISIMMSMNTTMTTRTMSCTILTASSKRSTPEGVTANSPS